MPKTLSLYRIDPSISRLGVVLLLFLRPLILFYIYYYMFFQRASKYEFRDTFFLCSTLPFTELVRRFPQAFAIIDRHAPKEPEVKPAPGGAKRIYRNTREFPPNPTLPAFYVQWRDGPSPYDPHRGDYTESAANMWERNVNFDLAYDGVRVPREDLGPRKGQRLLNEVAEGGMETVVKPNYFRMTVMPEEVHLNEIGTERNATKMYNPARDRQQMERELEKARTGVFFSHLRRSRNKLYNNCARNYPHGALGLAESPYGDPGEIYQDQQRRLLEAKLRAEHTMRGQSEIPVDHMMGPNQLRGQRFVRARVYNAPDDNLFASRIVLSQSPAEEAQSALAPGESYIRFRSQNVPADNLMGGVLVTVMYHIETRPEATHRSGVIYDSAFDCLLRTSCLRSSIFAMNSSTFFRCHFPFPQRRQGPTAMHLSREEIRDRLREKHRQRRYSAHEAAIMAAREHTSNLGMDPDSKPTERLSAQEWQLFLEELGCPETTPEVISYLLELEEEIRNDVLVEMYETATESSWEEYYQSLYS
eukprot:gene6171-4449_t